MTDCLDPEVRDALPDLIHGRLGEVDTATLLAHVEACDSCARELALLREVRASGPIVPEIDVARVVAALPARAPVSERPAPLLRRSSVVWKVATAAVIAVIGVTLVKDPVPERRSVAVAQESVAPAPPENVDSEEVTSGTSLSLVAGVADLTDDQLETLLAELDGIETLPSIEPDQSTITVEDMESAL